MNFHLPKVLHGFAINVTSEYMTNVYLVIQDVRGRGSFLTTLETPPDMALALVCEVHIIYWSTNHGV